MATVYLSIGSNIKPEYNVKQCAVHLSQHYHKPQWSPIYRSAAVGMDGADFLNAVVCLQTEESVATVIQTCKGIEAKQGRKRTANKFIDRTLDIDLILYDQTVLNTVDITLPSEEICDAYHVLVPLVDLAPKAIHPVLNVTFSELLQNRYQQDGRKALDLTRVPLNFN